VKAGKDVTIRIGRALSRLYGFDHRTRINDLHVDMWCGAELRRRGLWDELVSASVAKRLDDAMIDRAVAALPSLKELAS
jgi:hypothetical protein